MKRKMTNRFQPLYPAALSALVALALLSGCAGTEDYDQRNPNLSNPDEVITTSPVCSTELTYSAVLRDARLLDVVDVRVQYIDADGSVKTDTLTSPQWSKTVSFTRRTSQGANMADIAYGMMARTFLKARPVATQDSYDFYINIDSRMYDTHFDGKSTFTADVHACDSLKIMADKRSSVRTAAFVLDGANRSVVDSTAISYWCRHQSDTLIVKKPFTWVDSIR